MTQEEINKRVRADVEDAVDRLTKPGLSLRVNEYGPRWGAVRAGIGLPFNDMLAGSSAWLVRLALDERFGRWP